MKKAWNDVVSRSLDLGKILATRKVDDEVSRTEVRMEHYE
jgi:hypothetical protein